MCKHMYLSTSAFRLTCPFSHGLNRADQADQKKIGPLIWAQYCLFFRMGDALTRAKVFQACSKVFPC